MYLKYSGKQYYCCEIHLAISQHFKELADLKLTTDTCLHEHFLKFIYFQHDDNTFVLLCQLLLKEGTSYNLFTVQ